MWFSCPHVLQRFIGTQLLKRSIVQWNSQWEHYISVLVAFSDAKLIANKGRLKRKEKRETLLNVNVAFRGNNRTQRPTVFILESCIQPQFKRVQLAHIVKRSGVFSPPSLFSPYCVFATWSLLLFISLLLFVFLCLHFESVSQWMNWDARTKCAFMIWWHQKVSVVAPADICHI